MGDCCDYVAIKGSEHEAYFIIGLQVQAATCLPEDPPHVSRSVLDYNDRAPDDSARLYRNVNVGRWRLCSLVQCIEA